MSAPLHDSLLPNFASASEFMASSTGEVSHGDCFFLALLAALHTFNPARYPLSGDALAALRDDAISHGYAAPNGAINIPQADAFLHDRFVPHDTFCSYAAARAGYPPFAGPYTPDELHAQLRGYASGDSFPRIIETSTAGAGLPEDESAVQYHFFTTGGISLPASNLRAGDGELGGYWRADGDAVATNLANGPSRPLLTSWNEIAATNPVGWIVVKGEPHVSWTAERDSAGNITGAHDEHGAHAGAGDAAVVLSKYPQTSSLIPSGETYWSGAVSVLPLDNDVLVLAGKDASGNWKIVDLPFGGQAVQAQWQALRDARNMIQSLQDQLAKQTGGQMSLADALHIVSTAILSIPGVQ